MLFSSSVPPMGRAAGLTFATPTTGTPVVLISSVIHLFQMPQGHFTLVKSRCKQRLSVPFVGERFMDTL